MEPVVGRWSLVVGMAPVQIAYAFGRRLLLRPQVLEQELLLSGHEAQLEPAEDVIHDRLGEADVGIARPSAGLEAGVRELFRRTS